MNFMPFLIKFIKFKPLIKLRKFELHNYGSYTWNDKRYSLPACSVCELTRLVNTVTRALHVAPVETQEALYIG